MKLKTNSQRPNLSEEKNYNYPCHFEDWCSWFAVEMARSNKNPDGCYSGEAVCLGSLVLHLHFWQKRMNNSVSGDLSRTTGFFRHTESMQDPSWTDFQENKRNVWKRVLGAVLGQKTAWSDSRGVCHKGEASAVISVRTVFIRLAQKATPRDNLWLHLLTPLSPAAPGSGDLSRYSVSAAACPGRGISWERILWLPLVIQREEHHACFCSR